MRKSVFYTITSFLVLLLLVASLPSSYAYDENSAPSSWAEPEIEQAANYGLVTEETMNNFQGDLTREDFCGLAVKLYNAIGEDDLQPVDVNPFEDTKNTYVLKAYNAGLVIGISENKFAPRKTLTREEAAVIFYGVVNAVLPEKELSTDHELNFVDKENVSPWALEALNYLNWKNIIKGVGENRLSPGRDVSREEGIALTKRMFEEFKKYTSEPQKEDLEDEPGEEEGQLFREKVFAGMSEEKLLSNLGEPARKDPDELGFSWYVYNQDYSRFIMVGVLDGEVAGIYSNSKYWLNVHDIKVGTNKETVRSKFGQPISFIHGDSVILLVREEENVDTFRLEEEGYFIAFFYDAYENDTVTSVQLLKRDMVKERAGKAVITENILKGYERQIFDLANSIRVRNGKEPLNWDDSAAKVAREHSLDMAERDYFSHITPGGATPLDRMFEQDIDFTVVAENIAGGKSAVGTHEEWMNSESHRENILGDYTNSGVGSAAGKGSSEYPIYHTQMFFAP